MRSRPPANGLARRTSRTKSLRKKSGKKAGGQLGHRGETLHLVAAPEAFVVVALRPSACTARARSLTPMSCCASGGKFTNCRGALAGHRVSGAARALSAVPGRKRGRLPVRRRPGRAQYGPQLRALAVYLVEEQLLPLGRVQRLLADLLGVRLGRGTLVRWIGQAGATLAPVEDELTVALRQAPVLHNDETGVRRAGKLAWAQVASTSVLQQQLPSQTAGALCLPTSVPLLT